MPPSRSGSRVAPPTSVRAGTVGPTEAAPGHHGVGGRCLVQPWAGRPATAPPSAQGRSDLSSPGARAHISVQEPWAARNHEAPRSLRGPRSCLDRWSGRSDSNARPPEPHSRSGHAPAPSPSVQGVHTVYPIPPFPALLWVRIVGTERPPVARSASHAAPASLRRAPRRNRYSGPIRPRVRSRRSTASTLTDSV